MWSQIPLIAAWAYAPRRHGPDALDIGPLRTTGPQPEAYSSLALLLQLHASRSGELATPSGEKELRCRAIPAQAEISSGSGRTRLSWTMGKATCPRPSAATTSLRRAAHLDRGACPIVTKLKRPHAVAAAFLALVSPVGTVHELQHARMAPVGIVRHRLRRALEGAVWVVALVLEVLSAPTTRTAWHWLDAEVPRQAAVPPLRIHTSVVAIPGINAIPTAVWSPAFAWLGRPDIGPRHELPSGVYQPGPCTPVGLDPVSAS
jgi:hypothetical protein